MRTNNNVTKWAALIAVTSALCGCSVVRGGKGRLTDLKTGTVYECTSLDLYDSNKVGCEFEGGRIELYNDFAVSKWDNGAKD